MSKVEIRSGRHPTQRKKAEAKHREKTFGKEPAWHCASAGRHREWPSAPRAGTRQAAAGRMSEGARGLVKQQKTEQAAGTRKLGR